MVAFVVGIAFKSTALLVLGTFAATVLWRSSAASRYLIWTLTIAGLLLLPALQLVLPEWRLSVPERFASVWLVEAIGEGADLPSGFSPDAEIGPVRDRIGSSMTSSFADVNPGGTSASSGRDDRWTNAVVWGSLIGGAVWFACLIGLLARLLLANVKVRMVARRARHLPAGRMARLARRISADLGVARRIRIYSGEPNAMPFTWGVIRPSILLPSSAVAWPEERLRRVLTHELTHVRRHDCAIQQMAELARALYCLNPLAWFAVRRLRVEREVACDDAVILAGALPSAYAADLVEIALSFEPDRHAAPASLGMARLAQLSGRVRTVLDEGHPRSPVARAMRAVMVGLAGVCVLSISAARPVVAGPGSDGEVVGESAGGVSTGRATSAVPGMSGAETSTEDPDAEDLVAGAQESQALACSIAMEDEMEISRWLPPLMVLALAGCDEQEVTMPDVGGGETAAIEFETPTPVAEPEPTESTGPETSEPTATLSPPVTISRSPDGSERVTVMFRSNLGQERTDPLIVVDGVILESAQNTDISGYDIANIEVIRGGAAMEIYGEQAANGVISITTNRAETNQQGALPSAGNGANDSRSTDRTLDLGPRITVASVSRTPTMPGARSAEPDPNPPTFVSDVAPIFEEGCQTCHQPGGTGPMSFTTWDQIRPWGPLIRSRVLEAQALVDSGASDQHLGLSSEEADLIIRWVDAAMPTGD